jgi:hypothetical protein
MGVGTITLPLLSCVSTDILADFLLFLGVFKSTLLWTLLHEHIAMGLPRNGENECKPNAWT